LIERAVRDREPLLREFHEFHVAAMNEDRDGVRRYIVAATRDPNLQAEAANLMARSAVEVDVLTEDVRLNDVIDADGRRIGERTFPAGSLVVEVGQPRVVGNLFDPAAMAEAGFTYLPTGRPPVRP
jgi:hypothetical protein